MKIAPVADVKAHLSAYLDQVEADGPLIITRNGKAVAVLLAPRDDDDLEHLLLSRSPRVTALLAQSRASVQAGQGLSADAFWEKAAERQSKAKRKKPAAPKA